MSRRKIVIVVIIAVFITLFVAIALSASKRNNKVVEDNHTTTEAVSGNELSTPEESKDIVLPTPDEIKESESLEGYVDFVYDADESRDDYISSKVRIEGSGTVIENSALQSATSDSTTTSGPDITQETWYEASEDKDNYINAVTGYDFSNGFGAVMSQKYNIQIFGIYATTALLHAPNETVLRIEERNPSVGDATYWRHIILNECNFGYYASIMKEPMIPYGTPYELGTGIKNWEAIGADTDDYTLTADCSQILCDDYITCSFGEGYYFEYYVPETGTYCGHMVIQHGTRVYHISGDSIYHESLKDIITACADRCITVY